MAIQTEDIEITPTGEVLVDIHGFLGRGCDALLKAIAGTNQIVSSSAKPEFYKEEKHNLIKK